MQTAESTPCLPIRNRATSLQGMTTVLNGLRIRTPSLLVTSATRVKIAIMHAARTNATTVKPIPPPLDADLSTCVNPTTATKAPKPTPATSWLLLLQTVLVLVVPILACATST